MKLWVYTLLISLLVLFSFRKEENQPASIISHQISNSSQTMEFEKSNPEIVFENKTSDLIYFSFSLNNKKLLTSNAELINDILAIDDDRNLGFPYQAWKYILENNYHFDPFTREIWLHNPFLYLNSFGTGYCDDVASVYASIMRMKGFNARVWALNGNVVPEVFYNNKWMLFDPDLEVFYYNDKNEVASVSEVANNGDLIRKPILKLNVKDTTAFSYYLADIYTTSFDNEIAAYYDKNFDMKNTGLPLPKGSYTLMRDDSRKFSSIFNTFYPKLTSISLQIAEDWSGDLNIPLKLVRIQGEGIIKYNNAIYTINEFQGFLETELNTVFVKDLRIVSSKGIKLSFLINPTRFKFHNGYYKLEIFSSQARSVKVILN